MRLGLGLAYWITISFLATGVTSISDPLCITVDAGAAMAVEQVASTRPATRVVTRIVLLHRPAHQYRYAQRRKAWPHFSYGRHPRRAALWVLAPLLCRFAPRAGFVALRQTFVPPPWPTHPGALPCSLYSV